MTEKEAQKVLDELQGVRPEVLNGEAKRLFEAIMTIADERDKIKQEYDRDTHILQNQLDLANAKKIEKDKIIDLMTETINNYDIDEDICKQMGQNKNCNEYKDKEKCKACIKRYFENKLKEEE